MNTFTSTVLKVSEVLYTIAGAALTNSIWKIKNTEKEVNAWSLKRII